MLSTWSIRMAGVLPALFVVCAAASWATDAGELKSVGPAPVPADAAREPAKPGTKLDFPLTHNMKKDGSGPADEFVVSKHWIVSDFPGTGAVWTQDGAVYIGKGNDMTGIKWTGPLVKMNYEVTLEAMRAEGDDFFCGLTFPYGEDPCSLIVGGWGGTLVGISSLDYIDASENGTARHRDFENGKWYPIRLRVTPEKIEAWIDEEKLVDVETKGRKIGIRWEMEFSRPFGFATWRTTGAIRNVKFRAFEGSAN